MMEACCSRFTPAEGGARLAASASMKNTLATEYSSFIATRLVHEEAYKIRGCLFEGSQRSVYVTRASRIQYVAYELRILTDLSVIEGTKYEDVYDWSAELDKKEVLICTSTVLKQILENEILTMANINVLILDSCHLICKDENLQYIMKLYKESDENSKPRILALTYPLFASNKNKETQEQPTEEISNDKDSDNSDSEADLKIEDKNNDTESNLNKEQEVSNKDNQILENKDNNNELDTSSSLLLSLYSNEEIESTQKQIESTDKEEESTKKEEEYESSKDMIDDIKKQGMNVGVYENLDDFNMYEKLEWKIENLEKDLCCQMDLAEDIDGGKRLLSSLTKPKELIIEYSSRASEDELPQSYIELEMFMRETVNGALAFIDDHRHDPSEIYGEELCEEFKNIPEPTIDPRNLFQQFLYVLEQLGPYAADKAAVSLLTKLEKLKIKVPYERHFLLLCLCTTTFVKIRCYADLVFSQYESDWEKIRVFCTPKLLKLAEILEKFRPADCGMDIDGRKAERSDSSDKKVGNEGSSEQVNSGMDDYQIDSENVDVLRKVKSKDDSMDVDRGFEANNSKIVDNRNEQKSIEAGRSIAAYSTDNYSNIQDVSKKADGVQKVNNTIKVDINQMNSLKHLNNDLNMQSSTLNNKENIDEDLTDTQIPILDINIKQNSHIDANMVATEGNIESNVVADNNISRNISDVKMSGSICMDSNNLDNMVAEITKIDVQCLKEDLKDTSDIKEETNHNISGVAVPNDKIITNNKQNIPNKSLTYRMIKDIDNCDFTTLGDKIQDRVNTYEANLRDFDDFDNKIPVIDKKSSEYTTSISNSSTEHTIISSNESTNVSQFSISSNISASVSNIPIAPNDLQSSTTNTPNLSKDVTNTSITSNNSQIILTKPSNLPTDQLELRPRRLGARTRGRGRGQRLAGRGQQGQLCPDALCGLVFTKEPLIAKILFMLIVDMSRCNPKLSFICAQYCTVEQTTERSELKECQRQNKMQEDVLKKFRMHECNLLLATPALEEGIDLPRCNLVLRWDLPPSYRSYGLCRSRARATRATAALLCCGSPPITDMLLHNVATYKELDQIISRKCCCGIQDEPPQIEEDEADPFTAIIKPYTPNDSFNINPLNKNNIKSMQFEVKNDSKHLDVKESDVQTKKETKIDNCTNNDTINKISAVCDSESEIDNISAANEINIDNVINKDVNLIKGVNNCESNNINDFVPSKDILLDEQISSDSNNMLVLENESLCQFNTSEMCNDTDRKEESNNQVNKEICIKHSTQLESDKKQIISKNNSEEDNKKVISHYNKNKRNEEEKEDIKASNQDTLPKEPAKESVLNEHNIIESGLVDTDVSLDGGKDNVQNDKMTILYDKNGHEIINKSKSANNTNKDISHYKNNKHQEEIGKDVTPISNNDTVVKESANESILKEFNSSESGKVDTVSADSVKIDGNSVGVNVNCDIESGGKDGDNCASVDLNSAIALINRYCGKLPSDTFTRLSPQWWMEEVKLPLKSTGEMRTAYICTLRLPLNCPVKYNIVGHPMPTRVLARRMVALQACRILHKSGELDNQLMPIGKENFKAAELEGTYNYNNDCGDINDIARPGTTKRRQYYFKRTAWAFTDCQPIVDTSDSEIDPPEGGTKQQKQPKIERDAKNGGKRNMLYALISTLRCALPERYNTRGRRLHAPQHAAQAMGILMARDEPDSLQIPAFPVYTRSGEVRVSVEHVPDADVRLSPRRGRLIRRFMRFVFAEVLRVRRRGMKLQSEGSTHNDYYIVPTIKTLRDDGTTKIDIDWAFLELIYQHTEEKKHSEIERPILWHQDEEEDDGNIQDTVREKETADKDKIMQNPLLKEGEVFFFDEQKYKEAVVTPWYRNRDQPQFFLVAEICWNLTPDSAFPSATHSSFREYYRSKYNAVLTQSTQPLLDVDHTSARLNLLTPRYVNRKGVALPVSSERTRRAKRDRLDQKQILVPELCRVHPFAAPLWFATVALPCVLYRINALLIADEIRRAVAIDVGLGIPKIDDATVPGFQWPPLDFGWSLAEVLSADSEKNDKKREDDDSDKKEQKEKEMRDKEEKEKHQKEKEDKKPEVREKTINDILQEKEEAESSFEIGMWSNDMASSIPQELEYDEFMEPLPPNLTFCTSASGGTNWCDPIEKPKSQFNPSRTFSMADSDCSYMSSDFDTDDSDLDSLVSDDETDTSGFCSSKNSNAAMGVRIEYKTAHEAEAVDLERKKVNPAPQPDEADDELDRREYDGFIRSGRAPDEFIQKFRKSVIKHKRDIIDKGLLIKHDKTVGEILPDPPKDQTKQSRIIDKEKIDQLFPFSTEHLNFESGQVTLESIEKNKRVLLGSLKHRLSMDECKRLNCFSMVDVDIDSPTYVNEKVANVGFDDKEVYMGLGASKEFKPYYAENKGKFDFDFQPTLEGHPGPSPSVILQALTMSNANDGINLERLETIGDSFLKFAITAYLYCAHPTVHEGKLSHMRSKQVSNLNLYRLGRNKRLGARMIASKFEPHDNWLPPCHKPPFTLHPRTNESQEQSQKSSDAPQDGAGCFIPYNLITQHSIPDKSIADCVEALIGAYLLECGPRGALLFMSWLGIRVLPLHYVPISEDHPYVRNYREEKDERPPATPSPRRRRRLSSASSDCTSTDGEADDEQCFERQEVRAPPEEWGWEGRPVGSRRPVRGEDGKWVLPIYGELRAPPSPLLRYIEDPEGELEQMLSGYDALEKTLQYRFNDRSLLLQALTHASHQRNRLTDCYQRLEFLGDAILDYLITRHLYEDPRRHSPGALTDLRSALVNNTIFATLAARHGFHKFFRHMSPGLNEVLTKYVKIQEENGHSISEEHYLIQEDEMEQAEDVEVPKALGDLFESVAGAIFLDSGMSLGAVWKSYVNLMGAELEAFSAAAPKSPVRELLEAEPDTAKFGKPERLADGRRVRVCVEVFGRGAFKGVGRNYRIAKGTAARCALRHLKIHKAR